MSNLMLLALTRRKKAITTLGHLGYIYSGNPGGYSYEFNSETESFTAGPSLFLGSNTSHYSLGYSPDSKWIAMGVLNSPLVLMRRKGSTLTRLTATTHFPKPPGTNVEGLAWSPNSQHLVLANNATPFVHVLKANPDGETFSTISPLVGTALDTGRARCVSFSPDGKYLAVGMDGSGSQTRMAIYKVDGDVYTRLDAESVPTLTTANVYDLSWSKDGQYLAVAIYASPGLIVYRRNGDIFTKVSDATLLNTARGRGVAFNPDTNDTIALAIETSPFIALFKFDTATGGLTKISGTPVPDAIGNKVAWSPDGKLLALAKNNVTNGTTGGINVYRRSGDTYTALSASLFSAAAGNCTDVKWAPKPSAV